jgi:hypothetical protein
LAAADSEGERDHDHPRRHPRGAAQEQRAPAGAIQGPADPRRGDLADVQRHHHRRGADRQPDDDPGSYQDTVTGREGGEHHPGDEKSRRARHRGPAAYPVGDPARRQRTEKGPDQQDAGQQFLVEGRQAGEVLADEQQRPADDAGVVAEQQAAERGDRRAQQDMTPDDTWRQRRCWRWLVGLVMVLLAGPRSRIAFSWCVVVEYHPRFLISTAASSPQTANSTTG